MKMTLLNIEDMIPAEHRDLVFRVFLMFSRFEYALKRAGCTQSSTGDAKPAWDSFSSEFRDAFNPSSTPELQEACDYFSAHPPRKQIMDDGSLTWGAPSSNHRTRIDMATNRCPYGSQQSFHGGKFPIVSNEPIGDSLRGMSRKQCAPMPKLRGSYHFCHMATSSLRSFRSVYGSIKFSIHESPRSEVVLRNDVTHEAVLRHDQIMLLTLRHCKAAPKIPGIIIPTKASIPLFLCCLRR